MSMSSRINIQGDMERANANTLRMSYVPNNQSINSALQIDWQHDRQKAATPHGIVEKAPGSMKARTRRAYAAFESRLGISDDAIPRTGILTAPKRRKRVSVTYSELL